MSPDHWSNLTWDTVSAGGYDLFGPIGYLDRKRDRACKQRVIVTPIYVLVRLSYVLVIFVEHVRCVLCILVECSSN